MAMVVGLRFFPLLVTFRNPFFGTPKDCEVWDIVICLKRCGADDSQFIVWVCQSNIFSLFLGLDLISDMRSQFA